MGTAKRSVRVQRDKSSGTWLLVAEDAQSVVDANAFLEALAVRGLSPQTIRAYAFDLVWLHRWLVATGMRTATLDQAALLSFVHHQRERGAQPASINRRLTVCELFYRFVTGRDLKHCMARTTMPASHYRGRGRDKALGINILPASRRKLRVKCPHKLVEPLTRDQVVAFFSTLRRYRDVAIVDLMLFCGLRCQEVIGLRCADVQLRQKRLRVEGKGRRQRVIPLPAFVGKVIADYLRLERPETWTEELFVVLQGVRRGAPMTASGLRSLFRHRRESLPAVSAANAHRFRHTFGADMARCGVRLPVLARLMGHADAKTTLQYINLSMADIADAYQHAMEAIARRYGEPHEGGR
jgi:site-specific recombinase XerD